MSIYDIENEDDIFVLFHKITLPSLGMSTGYSINKLSNYFQLLLVLKGIKIGFMCACNELIDMKELETMVKQGKIANVSRNKFIFISIGLFRMIVDKQKAKNILRAKVSREINWTDDEIITFMSQMTNHHISTTIDSEIISSFLSYDCSMKGIENGFVRVKYKLELTPKAKILFDININSIPIYGFICPQEQVQYTQQEIHNRARQINTYLDVGLQLGRVVVEMI